MNDELALHPTFWQRQTVRDRTSAIVLLTLLASVAWLTVSMYNQSFTETVDVTVRSERAGLQMRKGTIVKLRGVDVGRTGSATLEPDGSVELVLKLKPEMAKKIPSNVSVSLQQLTAFGNKHVAFDFPATSAARHLVAGDVIQADHVSAEVNTLFEALDNVIAALPPAKVNATLGAIASSLQGQGASLGKTIDVLNAYLGKINRDMPILARDFDKGADVLDIYSIATPDLMSLLRNVSVTADSISSQRALFQRFLDSLGQVSERGTAFLDQNSAPLVDLLGSSLPTTELLARYSPMFSCFLQQMDRANRLQEANCGTRVPGVTAIISILGAGNEAYKNPSNLPVMGADLGPQCHGGPGYDGSYIPRSMMVPFDLGGEPNPPGPNEDSLGFADTPLAVQLFGPLAAQGGFR
jgi:phospholipid/cholesterol/gamma-HCH transport system substrate-binding protein